VTGKFSLESILKLTDKASGPIQGFGKLGKETERYRNPATRKIVRGRKGKGKK
jgi:hypothetical protein